MIGFTIESLSQDIYQLISRGYVWCADYTTFQFFLDEVSVYLNVFCSIMLNIVMSYVDLLSQLSFMGPSYLIFRSFKMILSHSSSHTPCAN